VKRLAEENQWNAEPGFLTLITLQGIVRQGALPRTQGVVDPIHFLEQVVGRFVRELTAGVDQAAISAVPAGDFIDFFLECHTGHEVSHAVRNRQMRILVRWRGFLAADRERTQQDGDQQSFCVAHAAPP